jgi:hypothetical protein
VREDVDPETRHPRDREGLAVRIAKVLILRTPRVVLSRRHAADGVVAQLGERLHGMQEVRRFDPAQLHHTFNDLG